MHTALKRTSSPRSSPPEDKAFKKRTMKCQRASLTQHRVSVASCSRFKLLVLGHFSVREAPPPPPPPPHPPGYLVFGVGRVHPLAVSAGLQQDLDGVQLQQDLAGHAVEERDVGQGRRRQEEDFTTGGALAQLCQGESRTSEHLPSLSDGCRRNQKELLKVTIH